MQTAIGFSYLIPLLPLIAAAVAGFFGARHLKGRSHLPIWAGVGASAVLSLWLLAATLGEGGGHGAGGPDGGGAEHAAEVAHAAGSAVVGVNNHLFTWIGIGTFNVPFGFLIDPLTAVMLAVVCGIGFLITVFAAGYMKGEEGYFRFFAFLGLFIFMMTVLVMGNNLVLLYLGWEGVGLCSYLLVGYYYTKPAAAAAAQKAFLVNRVGDLGFALGIMLCFLAFGSVTYFDNGHGLLDRATLAVTQPETRTYWQQVALDWVPFLLMLGAFGKSAQFPLYIWLPDAMEGPTPVSALIHAATMVTAGVYMIARCGPLFAGNEAALVTIGVVGSFTALFAGTIALRQFDLKKVFAYSTVSQLGFMFAAVAVLAPVAAVFHLVTHAFFKALLFLSSGVVMHAMGGVLDLRQMSGLKRVLPKTRWLMLVGCLALAGAPVFSGFFSKDEIIHAAFGGGTTARVLMGGVLLFTAFLTAYYTFRLYFRVFEGPLVLPKADGHAPDADDHLASPAHQAATGGGHGHGGDGHDGHDDGHHNHEPLIMIAPLAVLAVGAALAGFLNWPGAALGDFLGRSPSFVATKMVADVRFGAGNVDAAALGHHDPAAAHDLFNVVMLVSAAIAGLGILAAYVLHLRDRQRADRLAAGMPALTALLAGKYFVDEAYDLLIVRPLRRVATLFYDVDRYLIDGAVAAVSWVPQLGGWALKLGVQRGSLQGYASAMLFGVLVILVVVFS
jgi:NADH-quinone oxidoreductase subunit L